MSQGLYNKYEVYEDGEPVHGAFVLEPANDPAARAALARYAWETDDHELKVDLHEWLENLAGTDK